MSYTIFFISAALVQLSSAQVLSYVSRNSIPQQAIVANIPNAINNAKSVPSNNAVTVARVSNAVPVASNVAASANPVANPNLANANIANANIGAINANAPAHNIVNANYAASYANAANYANANYANAANYANVAYANQNFANSYAAGNAPANPANAYANPNLNSVANENLAAITNGNLPTINGNIATFNLGTNGNTFTVTSGSPGAQGFGISVIADALEVGGTVAVNGQIPIFGTVALNGNVPTDGSASVSYNCGGKQAPTNQI